MNPIISYSPVPLKLIVVTCEYWVIFTIQWLSILDDQIDWIPPIEACNKKMPGHRDWGMHSGLHSWHGSPLDLPTWASSCSRQRPERAAPTTGWRGGWLGWQRSAGSRRCRRSGCHPRRGRRHGCTTESGNGRFGHEHRCFDFSYCILHSFVRIFILHWNKLQICP